MVVVDDDDVLGHTKAFLCKLKFSIATPC